MNIIVTTKTKNISNEPQNYARVKARKVYRTYKLNKMEIIMALDGRQYNTKIVAHPKQGKVIIGISTNDNWLESIDMSIEKIKRQFIRTKEKKKSKSRASNGKFQRDTALEEAQLTYENILQVHYGD